jgi:glycosyltransferase involved in cell wall biosynthesis
MARLAWFTPYPPDRSGIAAYSRELLSLLATDHAVDVFVDRPGLRPSALHPDGSCLPLILRSAHDFVWLERRQPYDLVIYQLGNATCHDYMWAYFPRYPGLVVLHDAQVHQARAKQLLTRRRTEDYAAELRFSHPHAAAGLEDLVAAGFGGSLFYFWPMLGVVMRAARAVVVHGRWLASSLEAEFPGVPVETIRMGVAEPHGDRAAVRERLGIGAGEVVFAAFGRVTPEKRIDAALRGLAHVLGYAPAARLLLVGDTADYYDVVSAAEAAGVVGRVTTTGYVPDDSLADYIAAADVCLCMRWPTARETSASWLRSLAAGKPTIVTELAQMSSVPALDPRTWTPLEPRTWTLVRPSTGLRTNGNDGDPRQPGTWAPVPPSTGLRTNGNDGARSPSEGPTPPVTVAIDILDEQHSLGLAMRRLATDALLREELGREARRFWERRHTLAHMADDYRAVIARTIARPNPDRSALPAHLLDDGTRLARRIVAEVGVDVGFLDGRGGGSVPEP